MAELRNRDRYVVFQKSNVRYEVIGYIDLFKQLERQDLIDYYNKRYVPNNMVFVAAGDFDAGIMLKKIEDAFKDFPRGNLIPINLPEEPIRPGTLKYVDEFAIEQARGHITKVLKPSDYKDFIPLDMAMEILFAKRSSKIPYKIVEELKLANWIYGYFNEGGGFPEPMLKIIFECDEPSQLDEVVKVIDTEIANVLKEGITQEQIDEVINRYKAEHLLRVPTISQDCNQIGWDMIVYGVPDIYETKLSQFEKLTPSDVEMVIKKYFTDNNRVIFYGVPEGEKAKLIEKEKQIVKTEIEKIELTDNTILLYKQNTTAPIIDGAIYFPVSTEYETLETTGTLEFMLDLLSLGGTKNYSSLDISDWLENHAVKLRTHISFEGLYIYFKCLKADYPQLEKMLIDIMNNPIFEEKEVILAKERRMADYQRSLSKPNVAHRDFRRRVLYKGQRDGVSEEERNNIIQNLTRDDLIKMHKEYFNAQSAIITLFGDLTLEEAKNYAMKLRKNIPNKPINAPKIPLVVPSLDGQFDNPYSFEQCNININFVAPTQNDADFQTMRVIETVLTGANGRLHKATREVNDLSYFAYAQYSYTKNFGFF